jgi:septal ring factor EnvC (AmiA/AmiB activator)
MSGELIGRLARRAIVLGATVAVLALAVGTVKVAADWRAAAAPLDVAPVGMDTINAQLVAETDRAGALSGQIDTVAGQVATLGAALLEATDHVSGDSQTAEGLKQELADARTKLEALQAQLTAAQSRLAALNQAAARQAAANSAPRVTSPVAGGGGHDDD